MFIFSQIIIFLSLFFIYLIPFFSSVGNNDVRPGLLFSHSSKRSAQIEKQRKNKNESNRERFKPVKQVQLERLQEGLNTALDSSNKGFAMLQKMGYKPGSSLGKQGMYFPSKLKNKTYLVNHIDLRLKYGYLFMLGLQDIP